MAEPFFRLLEMVVPPVVEANGTHLTIDGLERIPEHGGALITINHTSYVDWYPASIAALRRHRRLRFLIKAEMAEVPVVRYVIKHIKLIPVNRKAGAGAYAVAVEQLKRGELIGLHPEATISRSFELREFKTGAARMAADADVPIIPAIVWGAQRVWTKDHPRKLWHNKIDVLIKIGEPIKATGDVEQTTEALRCAMAELLDQAIAAYPHPAGAFWVPCRLGGSAPTMAEALKMREAELAERDRRRQLRAARRSGGLRRMLSTVSHR